MVNVIFLSNHRILHSIVQIIVVSIQVCCVDNNFNQFIKQLKIYTCANVYMIISMKYKNRIA